MCVPVSVLQFRSRRSSARCVWRERCVTASVLTLLYTHTLAWQPDTHSWSWMEPAYVKKKNTIHPGIQDGLQHIRESLLPRCFLSFSAFKSNRMLNKMWIFLLPPQSFGLMCIQLACYHGVKVLTTSHSPQKHTFLEQLRPSVGMYRPALRCQKPF